MVRIFFFIFGYSLINSFTNYYTTQADLLITVLGCEAYDEAEDYVIDMSGLQYEKFNRSTAVINGHIEFKSWPDDVALTLIPLQETNNGYVEMGGGKIDNKELCGFLSSDQIIIPHFKECSTLSEICPIPEGVYELNNFRPQESAFPQNLPEGNYQIKLTFHRLDDISVVYGGLSLTLNIKN